MGRTMRHPLPTNYNALVDEANQEIRRLVDFFPCIRLWKHRGMRQNWCAFLHDDGLSVIAVYAAVITERYPHQAPGLFKDVSDIGEMKRRFGGTAWKSYDESFRRERKSHQLGFGQIRWDLHSI